MSSTASRPNAVRSPRMRRSLTIFSVATAGALALTACGGGSSAGGSSSSSQSNKVILIGDSAMQSGATAAYFVETQGFNAYLKYVNSQGGVNGYTFKWTIQDNANDPTQAALAQSKLAAQNPFAISVVGTVATTAAEKVAANSGSKIPLVVSADGALVDSMVQDPTAPPMFTVLPDYSRVGEFDASFILKTLHDDNFGLAYEDDSLAQGAEKAISSYVPQHGGHLAATVAVPATSTSLVPLVTRLQAAHAKTVLLWTNSNLTASLQKAATQIGYKPTWVTPFFALNDGYLQAAGKAADNTYIDGILPPTTSTDPAVQTFVSQVHAFAPNAVSGIGEQGWQMAAEMVAGIKAATDGGKTLTQSGYADAMKTVSGPVGLATVDFTQGHAWGLDEAGWYQVKDGKFTEIAKPSPLPQG